MAREIFTWSSGEIAIVAATRKVIVGVHVGTDVYARALIKRFGISANGIVAAGKPIYVRFCVAFQALAAGTTLSPGLRSQQALNWANAGTGITLQPFTAGKSGPTLPTTTVRVIREGEIHPNGGMWVEGFPLREEPELIGTAMCYWIDALGDTGLSMSGWIDVEE